MAKLTDGATHYLNDPAYRESEMRRYAIIDRERRNGLRAGCIECNQRDAHPSVGVCWVCERKIRSELRFLGFDMSTLDRPKEPPHE